MTATSGGRVIGRSGALDDGSVDPYAHFINVYMLDRQGRRVDRRNVQDIFVPLYDHQIPPSAAAVVHYGFDVPAGITAPIEVEVKLQYRKFTRFFTTYSLGPNAPELPITTIASDRITFPVAGRAAGRRPRRRRRSTRGNAGTTTASDCCSKARPAARKASCDRPPMPSPKSSGWDARTAPLNLARVFFKEGRLDEAASALRRAAAAGAPPWTVAWLSGLVNKENGFLDQAIDDFERVLATGPSEVGARRFDFSADYEVINELGQALFERAKLERGPSAEAARRQFLQRAAAQFERTLQLDSENVTAHYVLSLIYGQLGDARRAAEHAALHARYKPDDNARDRAIATHRLANAAANHAAQSIVIYPLR